MVSNINDHEQGFELTLIVFFLRRKRMVSGIPPSRAEDIQRMEREIFDMLDPDNHRQPGASPTTLVPTAIRHWDNIPRGRYRRNATITTT